MSRIPEDVQFCDCYKAGSEPETLHVEDASTILELIISGRGLRRM